jgi:hypothetical protein
MSGQSPAIPTHFVAAPSAGFVGMKHGTHFLNMCSMGADRFMEVIAGLIELLEPIGDVSQDIFRRWLALIGKSVKRG